MALLKSLKVRALQPHEYQRAGQLLDREHYLGDVPQGRQLLQAVEYHGQWVALLDWGIGGPLPGSWLTGKSGSAGPPSKRPSD